MTSVAISSSSRRGQRRDGFTLLEVLIAASVILIALLGFAVALISTADLRATTHQTAIAMNIARIAIEEIEAMGDIDYVAGNMHEWCFHVTQLDSPRMDLELPDGTLPELFRSAPLPALLGAGDPADPAATPDVLLATELEGQPMALNAVEDTEPSSAFGVVRIDATDPDFVAVEVSIYFLTRRGNRKVSFHTHLLRPVDRDAFTF